MKGKMNFYEIPALFKKIILNSGVIKEHRVMDYCTDFYAYRAVYVEMMEYINLAKDGIMKMSELVDCMKGTMEKQEWMILFDYVHYLVKCKWLFHISPFIVDQNFERYVQPIFDPKRMTEEQYDAAFEAIMAKDYEKLIEAVPSRVKFNSNKEKIFP